MNSDLKLHKGVFDLLKDITNVLKRLSTDSGGKYLDKETANKFIAIDQELEETGKLLHKEIELENKRQETFESKFMTVVDR